MTTIPLQWLNASFNGLPTVRKLTERSNALRVATAQSEDNVYSSGLNRADWYALCGQVVPHYSSRDGKLCPLTKSTYHRFPSTWPTTKWQSSFRSIMRPETANISIVPAKPSSPGASFGGW